MQNWKFGNRKSEIWKSRNWDFDILGWKLISGQKCQIPISGSLLSTTTIVDIYMPIYTTKYVNIVVWKWKSEIWDFGVLTFWQKVYPNCYFWPTVVPILALLFTPRCLNIETYVLILFPLPNFGALLYKCVHANVEVYIKWHPFLPFKYWY